MYNINSWHSARSEILQNAVETSHMWLFHLFLITVLLSAKPAVKLYWLSFVFWKNCKFSAVCHLGSNSLCWKNFFFFFNVFLLSNIVSPHCRRISSVFFVFFVFFIDSSFWVLKKSQFDFWVVPTERNLCCKRHVFGKKKLEKYVEKCFWNWFLFCFV